MHEIDAKALEDGDDGVHLASMPCFIRRLQLSWFHGALTQGNVCPLENASGLLPVVKFFNQPIPLLLHAFKG